MISQNIKISIIVPAYNVDQWIARCVDSILVQTYKNLEIILINDGSTDQTQTILEEYSGKDDRIIVIHQQNAGLVAVREKGIKIASGDYIGFVDGDDEIEPDMYEKLLENAIENDADISQCGILYCFYDGRKKPMHGTGKKYIFDKINGYRELMEGTKVEPSLCNKLYKKELLKDSCLDAAIVNNEDLLRNSVLFSRAEKSVFEDFCGYHYWRRAESMSNNDNSVQISKYILQARKTVLDNAESNLRNYAMHNYLSAVLAVYNQLIISSHKDAKELKKICRNILHNYKNEISRMGFGMRCREHAIHFSPHIYNFVYRIHIKIIYRRIRNERKKL